MLLLRVKNTLKERRTTSLLILLWFAQAVREVVTLVVREAFAQAVREVAAQVVSEVVAQPGALPLSDAPPLAHLGARGDERPAAIWKTLSM